MKLFHLDHPLSHMVVTTVFSFLAILLSTKFLGKEQIAELTMYDYVNGIVMGDIAGTIATDPPDQAFAHAIDLLVYVLLTFGVAFVAMKSRWARRFLEGTPTVVIANGQIIESNLKRSRYNIDNLKAKLRAKEVFSFSDVQYAILENDGTVSVIRMDAAEKPTKQDLHVPTVTLRLPVDLVTEGKVREENLQNIGHDEEWLREQLRAYGLASAEETFYAGMDTKGRFFADPMDSAEQGSPPLE